MVVTPPLSQSGTAQLTTRDISGSWFPSGFYGHFRGKSRNDFINEYRYLAKPLPPHNFVLRCQEKPQRHVFSHHDNREAFKTDAMYFEQGLGRRRIKKATFNSNPELITWIPHKPDLQSTPNPHATLYQQCYSPPGKQLYPKRPITSFDQENQFLSMYRYSYAGENPQQGTLDQLASGVRTATRKPDSEIIKERQKRSKSCSAGVSDCMRWTHFDFRPPEINAGTKSTTRYRRKIPDSTSLPPYMQDYSTVKNWREHKRDRYTTLDNFALPIETYRPNVSFKNWNSNRPVKKSDESPGDSSSEASDGKVQVVQAIPKVSHQNEQRKREQCVPELTYVSMSS